MHSTQNESKSVVAERFIKILNGEIYKKWQLMIANLILVLWINYKIDAIILIIGLLIKKPINADYSYLTEEIKSSHTALKSKIGEQYY